MAALGFFHRARVSAGLYGVSEAEARLLDAIGQYSSWDKVIVWYEGEPTELPIASNVDFRPALRMANDVASGEVTALHHVGLGPATLDSVRGPTPLPVYTSVFPALSYNDQIAKHLIEYLGRKTDHDRNIFPSACSQGVVQRIYKGFDALGLDRQGAISSFVVPIGVDTDRFSPCTDIERTSIRSIESLDSSAVLATVIARFSPADKLDLVPLLRSIRRAESIPDNLKFVLAGGDAYFGAKGYVKLLQKEIERLELTNLVDLRIINDRDRLVALLRSSDLFLSPADSVQETFGITPVEAMSSGIPAIVSDWNGYRETVVHGITGSLIPTGMFDNTASWRGLSPLSDYRKQHMALSQSIVVDTDAMVDECSNLARHPRDLSAMAVAARSHALARYSWRHVIGRYETIWHKEGGCRFVSSNTCPATLDYYSTFSGYATRCISDEDLFEVMPPTSSQGSSTISVVSDLSELLSLDLVTQTIAALRTQPGSVESVARSTGVKIDAVRFCFSWLAKNGFVKLTALTR